MRNKNNEDLVLDNSAEIKIDKQVEEIDVSTNETIGVITDCLKLNVREKPDKNSEVVAIVNRLDKLNVYLDASTDEWYAVRTASGIEGFSMKKYISIMR
ncbi:MAG: SH3 domain-containing protein [Ruminococcus sp.]|nr:SH3 domain-containing protein [Ruminococcus sp.]